MQVDTSSATGSGIPATVTLSGSSPLFTYVDPNGVQRQARIIWTYWYTSAQGNGSVAKVGCETSSPPPPPPP